MYVLSLTMSLSSSPHGPAAATIPADEPVPKHQPFPPLSPPFGLLNILVLDAFPFQPSCLPQGQIPDSEWLPRALLLSWDHWKGYGTEECR